MKLYTVNFEDASGGISARPFTDMAEAVLDYIDELKAYAEEIDDTAPLADLKNIERRLKAGAMAAGDALEDANIQRERIKEDMGVEEITVYFEKHSLDVPEEKPRPTGFDFTRASRMHKVLHAYQREKGESMPTGRQDLDALLTDVLADLRHWAAGIDLYGLSGGGLDFDLAARVSKMHFEEESRRG